MYLRRPVESFKKNYIIHFDSKTMIWQIWEINSETIELELNNWIIKTYAILPNFPLACN